MSYLFLSYLLLYSPMEVEPMYKMQVTKNCTVTTAIQYIDVKLTCGF